MTDEEAIRELAKSLNHLENAMDAAESQGLEAKAGRTFDHLTDTINHALVELGNDDADAEVYKYR